MIVSRHCGAQGLPPTTDVRGVVADVETMHRGNWPTGCTWQPPFCRLTIPGCSHKGVSQATSTPLKGCAPVCLLNKLHLHSCTAEHSVCQAPYMRLHQRAQSVCTVALPAHASMFASLQRRPMEWIQGWRCCQSLLRTCGTEASGEPPCRQRCGWRARAADRCRGASPSATPLSALQCQP